MHPHPAVGLLGWLRINPSPFSFSSRFLTVFKMDTTTPSSVNFIHQMIDEELAAGKHPKIVTRFPPEPNGYLHIGHAKALCLDFGTAQKYNGECHLRLDDTNPAKESDEYAQNIKDNIHWLGFQWSGEGDGAEPGFYNASNMFDTMYLVAENLIRAGQAYCCNLGQDEWKTYRGVPEVPGKPSPSRDTDPERNLRIFHEMRDGKYADGEWCLRAKIDMASPNIHFRDPVLYRIRHVDHYHLGNRWCVYPMYDFAHPIEDALEGVTHSLCTLEFEVHRPLYDWVVDRLDEMGLLVVREGIKVRPRQIEFSRLNINWTVMSKRLLLQLVEQKHVAGWDDPRMPTLAGMRRRGYPAAAVRNFCEKVGITKVESQIDVGVLENCVREELNRTALRRMAVLHPLKVVIDNFPEGQTEYFEATNNPEDPAAGSHSIPFSRELWIEREDFMMDPPKKFFRLAPGREVRLRYACLFTCTSVVTDPATGEPIEIHGTWDPNSRGGNSPDGHTVKGTIHWVSAAHAKEVPVNLYDRLFSVENPQSDPERDFTEFLNPESLLRTTALVEPALLEMAPGESCQFERLGYFSADPIDSKPGAPVFNRVVTLRDSWAKIAKK